MTNGNKIETMFEADLDKLMVGSSGRLIYWWKRKCKELGYAGAVEFWVLKPYEKKTGFIRFMGENRETETFEHFVVHSYPERFSPEAVRRSAEDLARWKKENNLGRRAQ